MTKQLTKEAYLATMISPMKPILKSSTPAVDIWEYVAELVKSGAASNEVYENNLVESIYRNANNSFDHVLLPSPVENVFPVIVIDNTHSEVFGHFDLDLNTEYHIK